MDKGRLEAFSDGVIAIIITVMVLELKVPSGTSVEAIVPLLPVLSSYVLSFIFVAIYWNNHHHMLQAAERVNGRILWANQHLLFWLSLVPFVTAWMGEHSFAKVPVAMYGAVLLMSGIAYYILARALAAHHGKESKLAVALGCDYKGIVSIVIYIFAIPLAFFNRWIACGLYVAVAIMWLVPDPRIESKVEP